MDKLKDFTMTDELIFSNVYSLTETSSLTKSYIQRYYKKNSTPICFMYFKEGKSQFRIHEQELIEGEFFDGYEKSGIFYIRNEFDRELIKNNDLSSFKFIALPNFDEKSDSCELTPALFLDRDGIINVNTHYPHVADELKLIEEIIPIAKHYEDKGFKIIVTTNQSGIGRGYFKERDYLECVERINEFFKENGVTIIDHYHCPYHIKGIEDFAKDSLLRKPKPGMFLKAASEHAIDIHQSVMIGDNLSDIIEDIALKSYIIGENGPHGLTHENFLELV